MKYNFWGSFMNPILNQIGTVFIPVSNIEKARDWYCSLLGILEF